MAAIASMRVKICGITQVQQALEIIEMGAHLLGFICVRNSPRFIEAERIGEIVHAVRQTYGDRIQTVGVFADAAPEFLDQTLTSSGLTGIQLHGNESVEYCQQLREQYPKHELIKAFRIRDRSTLDTVGPFGNVVDTFLLDAYHPQALGGTGESWDWSLLKSHQFTRPWFLAGGLNPENIRNAIAACAPTGVDLSSGVESAPGVKDLAKVKALFEALRVQVQHG